MHVTWETNTNDTWEMVLNKQRWGAPRRRCDNRKLALESHPVLDYK
jgi:hypothetical protein